MLIFFEENLTKIKWKEKFNQPVLTSIDHFWSIDQSGFKNRLKPLVKTGGGWLVPTLIVLAMENLVQF